MNYKLINNKLEEQPKSIIYNNRTYIGEIPEEILLANKYYSLIKTSKPSIEWYQQLILNYKIKNNQIIEDWQIENRSIDEIRLLKLEKLREYDVSDSVNIFYYNKLPIWFSKSDRASLSYLCSCNKAIDEKEITFYYKGIGLKLEIDTAIQLLMLIEVYAGKCYNRTEQHEKNIQECQTINDIINYDFTIGYPDVLRFNENDC